MMPSNRYFRISAWIFLLLLDIHIYSCKRDNAEPPSVITVTIIDLTSTSATSGGIISNDGGAAIISKGICWNKSGNPEIGDNMTVEGGGSESFTSIASSLQPATSYYLKAYATNSAGTGYGNQTIFSTYPNDQMGSVIDGEGNNYKTLVIGTQTCMTENLKTTKFRNGTDIPMVAADEDWYNMWSPAYCVFNNQLVNKDDYGVLYNWYTVEVGQDASRNICPTGWHVPTDDEWSILITYLGGESAAVGKLKETGLTHWMAGNSDATNESGFTARPGGARDYNGEFYGLGYYGGWWTSTEFVSGGAFSRFLGYDGSGGSSWGRFEKDGFSVRCIKDSTPPK